jgi:chromosomal replication initiation ATPase DnaA
MHLLTESGYIAGTLRHGMPPQKIAKGDADLLRELARRFNAISASRPFVNKTQLALCLGLEVFGIEMAKMIEPPGRRVYARKRQLLMAFMYVAGHGEEKRRRDRARYLAIGRIFMRNHATVIHAVKKYEDGVRELLQ